MSVPKRLALDARLRARFARGYDSIVLLTPKGFQALRRSGAIPRSIELNVVDLDCLGHLAKFLLPRSAQIKLLHDRFLVRRAVLAFSGDEDTHFVAAFLRRRAIVLRMRSLQFAPIQD